MFQSIVFLNLDTLKVRKSIPSAARAAICCQSSANPVPLRNIPLIITRKYLSGLIVVIHWTGSGILEIGNINPERRTAGK